jgi:hypothetical protein
MRRRIGNFFRGLRFVLETAGVLMDVFQLTLIVISISCFGTQLYSQKNLVELKGRISSLNDSTESIPNAAIILSIGTDTVMRIQSDQSGKFHDSLYLSPTQDIKITFRKNYYQNQEVVYTLQPNMNSQLILNVQLPELKIDRPNYPVYAFNEITRFTEFDLDLLKHQLRGLPSYVIRFSSYRNPSETEAIGLNRLNAFIHFLMENGVDPQQLQVDYSPHVNNCPLNDDCHGNITGVLISIDSLLLNK